ncbi:MAG: flagellar assembly protein FliX [Hyphomonadaceae bacterium]
MKVESGRGVGAAGGTRKAGAAAAPGFAPAEGAGPAAPAAGAGPASAAAALDAVLALQAEGFDPGRRRRQVRRAEAALDALAQLERGWIEGRAPGRLRDELAALQAGAAPTGEPGLDAVLLEIDTRVAVELAKLERISA